MTTENPKEIKFITNENLHLSQAQPDKTNDKAVLYISYLNTSEFDSVTGEECSISDNRKARMLRFSKAMLSFHCMF